MLTRDQIQKVAAETIKVGHEAFRSAYPNSGENEAGMAASIIGPVAAAIVAEALKGQHDEGLLEALLK